MANLDRRRILIVEDEFMLAHDLQGELQDAGAVVIGPEGSVDRALARVAVEPEIDAAVLDVNLSGELVFPVADVLLARGVPFIFSSGYGETVAGGRYPFAMKCNKPIDVLSLLDMLGALLGDPQTATPRLEGSAASLLAPSSPATPLRRLTVAS